MLLVQGAKHRRRPTLAPAPALEKEVDGGEEEEGTVALQESVSENILLRCTETILLLYSSSDQENLAFTKQMKAKSRKIVMDAEHGRYN